MFARKLPTMLTASLLLLFSSPVLAQPSKPAKPAAEPAPYKTPAVKEDNAALEYLTLHTLFDPELLKLVSEEWKPNEPGWRPSEKLSILLEEAQPLIKRLITASRMPFSDFGIRYEDGFGAILSHLGHMRLYARILASDARRLAVAGRTDDAAFRLVTCIRMSAHLTLDRVLISSLLSMAINSVAMTQSEIIARDYGMSDAWRHQIIAAARSRLDDDPFGTLACIQMERTLAINSITPSYKGKGDTAGRELVKQFRSWQFDSEGLKELEALNEQQLDEQLDLMNRYYATLTNLWPAKDAQARLAELEDRLTRGDFGLLIRHLAPALTKCRASTDKALKEIKDVTALLEAGMTPPPPPAPEPADDSAE